MLVSTRALDRVEVCRVLPLTSGDLAEAGFRAYAHEMTSKETVIAEALTSSKPEPLFH